MQTTLWNCDCCSCQVILQREDPASPWHIAKNAIMDVDDIIRAPATPCPAHVGLTKADLFATLLGPEDSLTAEQRIYNAILDSDFLGPLGLLTAQGGPPEQLPEVTWSGTGMNRTAVASYKGRKITGGEKATIEANLARFNGRVTVSTD